jgi:CheY-like chemotaxis protein
MPQVLVVDDDVATRDSVAEALELAGFAVEVASGGDEALRVLSQESHEKPAAVVVDFVMPEMSGVELIRRLRALPGLQDVDAVLATAWVKLPDDLDPSIFVLRKPFGMETLLDALERCSLRAAGSPSSP